MCEYCRSWPHLTGCPNAPDPEPAVCPVCRKSVPWEEMDEDAQVCRDCLDKPRGLSEYRPFLEENLTDFVGWWYKPDGMNVEDWSRSLQQKLCGHLFQMLWEEYNAGDGYDKAYILSAIRDYIKEHPEAWGRWLRREGA